MAFLGLDVGGTSCRWEWWPAPGGPGGDAPGVQPAVHGVDAAADALAAVLAIAARDAAPTAAVIAIAGAGDPATAAALVAALRRRGIGFPVEVVGDVLAAAAAGLGDGPGVLVWAGTGSFAVARDHAGGLHRVGGRGFLLGDQGSGYDLVRRAAAAALLAADGLAPPTALTASLTAAFGAPSPQRLGAVLQRSSPGEVAARLGLVLDAAAAGDGVAQDVLAQGADALAALAAAAVRAAGLEWRDLATVLGGGVLGNVPSYCDQLARRLLAFGARPPRRLGPRDPARAAAWLAHGSHHRLEPATTWVSRVTL